MFTVIVSPPLPKAVQKTAERVLNATKRIQVYKQN